MAPPKDNNYRIKGRIWIEINDDAFIGEGKALLLKRTAELGSLRKAAEEMNMSYRKAWYSINHMNKAAGEPVIVLKHGGRKGGIAQLTPFGEKVLEQFDKLDRFFHDFLDRRTKRLKF